MTVDPHTQGFPPERLQLVASLGSRDNRVSGLAAIPHFDVIARRGQRQFVAPLGETQRSLVAGAL